MKPDAWIFNLACGSWVSLQTKPSWLATRGMVNVVGGRSLGIRTLHLIRYEIVDESNDEISTLRAVVESLKHQQQEAR